MRNYTITSPEGERTWQADDFAHAEEQHKDAFPEEPILSIRTGASPAIYAATLDVTAIRNEITDRANNGVIDEELEERLLALSSADIGDWINELVDDQFWFAYDNVISAVIDRLIQDIEEN